MSTKTPVGFRCRIYVDDREVRKWVSRTPQQINEALWDAAPEIAAEHIELIRPYPPELPGQRYVRTWRMLHGWHWARRHVKDQVVIHITNKMTYTRFVKDERWQARIHEGRHITIQAVNRQLAQRSQGIWQRHLRAKVKR